jgi:hypothetical protein
MLFMAYPLLPRHSFEHVGAKGKARRSKRQGFAMRGTAALIRADVSWGNRQTTSKPQDTNQLDWKTR